MSPRKKQKHFASTQSPQSDAHAGNVAGYNGPITRSRALPRPIHNLPLEVLGEILIFAFPTDQELYSLYEHRYVNLDRRKLINPTLVFCAVCSSWRFLAFSTPRLWNTVLIHIPRNINRAQAIRKAANLVQWIERARSLPMTLHIFGFSIDKTPRPEAPILSVINDHAARWESLYSPDPQSFDFSEWHSLRRLCSPSSDPVSRSCEIAPWVNLTHLGIRIYSGCWDPATIFTKCPKLVYLSILINYPSKVGPSTAPLVLEDLVTFHLMMNSADGSNTLLPRFSLPSLREFSFAEVSESPGGIPSILSLLIRSSCSLDKLEIRGLCIPSRDHLDLLAHSSCHSLTSLTLRHTYPSIACSDMYQSVDEELLRRLTLHQNDTVCHRLTSLVISYCIPTPLHSALLNMVESRIKSDTGQVPEEPALRFLQLHLEYLRKTAAGLDKVGRRSGMEYNCKKSRCLT